MPKRPSAERGASGRGAAPARLPRSQPVRFVAAGGLTAAVYWTTTSLLLVLVGMPAAPAVAIGYVLGLLVHFTLQRTFVFAGDDPFALSLHRQVMRYVAVAAAQYGATNLLLLVLRQEAGLPRVVAFLVSTLLVTPTTFVVLRTRLFHRAEPPGPGAAAPR